jgi:N-acetylmuramoyl-L-alanine amidase
VYGAGTEAAVEAFQSRRGLRADGICGEQTWASLVEAGYELGDRLLYLRAPMLRGDDVAELQRLLGLLGFDAGKVDGILGPRTADATTEFQRNAGLTTDGICGPDTVAALRRYRRAEEDGPRSIVASLREAEGLRRSSRLVVGHRVAVADCGGVAALAAAVARVLTDRGAIATVITDIDDSARAAAANAFESGVFLALVPTDTTGVTCAFYAHGQFESVGGRRLATLATDAVAAALGGQAAPPQGMRLPLLRETRMPAVVVELGPTDEVVVRTSAVAEALADAVERWVAAPVE